MKLPCRVLRRNGGAKSLGRWSRRGPSPSTSPIRVDNRLPTARAERAIRCAINGKVWVSHAHEIMLLLACGDGTLRSWTLLHFTFIHSRSRCAGLDSRPRGHHRALGGQQRAPIWRHGGEVGSRANEGLQIAQLLLGGSEKSFWSSGEGRRSSS